MNKKAQFSVARKMIYWGIIGGVVSILVLTLFFLLGRFSDSLTYVPPELESNIRGYRFINSPDCFTYQDPLSGRVDLGLIDLEKFTDKRLNSCYENKDKYTYNFKLVLENLETKDKKTIKTKHWYEWLARTVFYPVRIKDKDQIYFGRLSVYVQDPFKKGYG